MVIENVDQEKRLTELKREVLARGFDRHPSFQKTISELPPELQSPGVSRLAEGEAFQRIIFFPQQIQRGWSYVPKQALLFTETQMIHLLAGIWPGEEPRITKLNSSGLLYLKATLILLYGFLEIIGEEDDTPIRLEVEFNAVFWDFLAPSLRKVLLSTKENIVERTFETPIKPELQKGLEDLPLKFANGVRIHGLLPGERLEEFLFQPRTWKRRLLLFRKGVTPDTLLLLTTEYLVILREELGVKQGWVIAYFPRKAIQRIECEIQDKWSDLTFHLVNKGKSAEYKQLLSEEAGRGWREIWVRQGGAWRDKEIAQPTQ